MRHLVIFSLLASAILTIGSIVVCDAASRPDLALTQTARCELDDVKGRIDHLAYDQVHGRLFVAALGNDTIEVINVNAGKRIHTITGVKEPQGLRYLPQNILVAAEGEGGKVDFFNGDDYRVVKQIPGYADADNVRYDKQSDMAIVGWGSGALTWFGTDGNVVAKVQLPAHPESFQLSPSRDKLYVNVPNAGKVVVIDLGKRKVLESWSLHNASANYPMCLDDKGKFVFVACRRPAEIITFNAENGKELARIKTSGDADDIFYDAANSTIYESCGEGFLDIFKHDGTGNLIKMGSVTTAAGARTSLFVPELRKLFLAIPKRQNQRCEIREFTVR